MNYINGIFVKRSPKKPEYINIGLKKAEFLKAVQELKEDEKGFINLTMAENRAKDGKYSVWENTWKGNDNGAA